MAYYLHQRTYTGKYNPFIKTGIIRYLTMIILELEPSLFLKQFFRVVFWVNKPCCTMRVLTTKRWWMSQPSQRQNEWPQISSQGFNSKGLSQDLPSSQKGSQLEWQTGRRVMWKNCTRTKESTQECKNSKTCKNRSPISCQVEPRWLTSPDGTVM